MRGRLAVLTVVFVFASSAFLPTPASAQGTGSLDGMVCVHGYSWIAASNSSADKGTSCMDVGGAGLPGATITLVRSGTLPSPVPAPLGPSTLTATSDANGYYSFSGVTAGDYDYTVTRQGFKSASGTVSVEAGSRQDAILAGEVVDAKGIVTGPDGAIAKAEVMLCCGQAGQHAATTGSDGRYSVSVQAGYWSVAVGAPGFQGQDRHLLVDGAAIDFELERIPPQDAKLTGTVLDQDEKPVEGARVSLYSYGGGYGYGYDTGASPDCYDCASMSYRPSHYSGENVTYTDAQGRFVMGAYSGGNGLSVSKDGYAYHSRGVDIQPGQTASADVTLMKYPEKTAKIVGKVVDAKTGAGLANAYISLQSPEYGLYECSQPADGGSGSGSTGSTMTARAVATPMGDAVYVESPPESYDPGCAIKTRSDGTFEGLVTPGYAILSVWVDTWSACYQKMESSGATGGASSFDCDTYYSWVKSQVLPADGTTTFDVKVRQRPGPDAEASGYVIDADTGQAIPGAQVSFSNQDSYGYGHAVTDEDGSYRLRLRSGFHSVSVWAEGHLRWEGVVDVPKGDIPFDITIEPGQEANGYYGPYYGGYAMESGDAKAGSSMAATSTANGAPAPDMASPGRGSSSEQYQDLGGGLGPYDADKRADQLEEPSKGSPGLGLLAMLAAIGAVLVLRRRLA